MKVDRYTKIVLTIIAAGLWTLILMAVATVFAPCRQLTERSLR